jgi:hypothetical protein
MNSRSPSSSIANVAVTRATPCRASAAPVSTLRSAGHDVQGGKEGALASVVRADHEHQALGAQGELGLLIREEVGDLQLREVHVRASITRRRTLDSTASNMLGSIDAALVA